MSDLVTHSELLIIGDFNIHLNIAFGPLVALILSVSLNLNMNLLTTVETTWT